MAEPRSRVVVVSRKDRLWIDACEKALRERGIESIEAYNCWSAEVAGKLHGAEALVVDLWFSLQAGSRLCDVGRLEQLEAHPAFDARNPNKLRAVYGAFAQRNHRNFHALDGSGYEFLASRVLALNATNPQIAARLLTPLTRWQR